MSPVIKLGYVKFPAEPSEAMPGRFDVLRPVIPVELVNGRKRLSSYAMIDSGADYCVFHASLGEIIGLNIESGKAEHFRGVSGDGDNLTAYFHTICLAVEGYEFECWTGFSRDVEDSPYGLSGQQGFFSQFSVYLNHSKKNIELKTV